MSLLRGEGRGGARRDIGRYACMHGIDESEMK